MCRKNFKNNWNHLNTSSIRYFDIMHANNFLYQSTKYTTLKITWMVFNSHRDANIFKVPSKVLLNFLNCYFMHNVQLVETLKLCVQLLQYAYLFVW